MTENSANPSPAKKPRPRPEKKASASRPKAEFIRLEVENRQQLHQWLEENHETSPGVWLVTCKKASGRPAPSYEEVVEEALCFGWIDSRVRTVDADRSEQMLTPRRPTSTWSQSNKLRLERLIPSGRMTRRGMAAVEVGKENGSWSALDSIDRLEVPDDLADALGANPGAKANFDAFSATSRRGLLWWVASAKRPQTRANRVALIVEQAAVGKRANFPQDR